MTEQTSIAECAEFKVRSRLAQHLQEPHSPIRLKASDLVKLLEEFETLRGQVAKATAAHVEQVAAMQGELGAAREAYQAALAEAAEFAKRQIIDERRANRAETELDQTRALWTASRRKMGAHIRRLQRELRAARAA